MNNSYTTKHNRHEQFLYTSTFDTNSEYNIDTNEDKNHYAAKPML